jgi:hypothetical protein
MVDGHALADSFEGLRAHPAVSDRPLDPAAELILGPWRRGGRHLMRVADIQGTAVRVIADGRELHVMQVDDSVCVFWPVELLELMDAAGWTPPGLTSNTQGSPTVVRAAACALRTLPLTLNDVVVLDRPISHRTFSATRPRDPASMRQTA